MKKKKNLEREEREKKKKVGLLFSFSFTKNYLTFVSQKKKPFFSFSVFEKLLSPF